MSSEQLIYIAAAIIMWSPAGQRADRQQLAIDGEPIVNCSAQLTVSGRSVVPWLAFICLRSPLLTNTRLRSPTYSASVGDRWHHNGTTVVRLMNTNRPEGGDISWTTIWRLMESMSNWWYQCGASVSNRFVRTSPLFTTHQSPPGF